MPKKSDFVLKDITNVFWPSIPPYRNMSSKRGYKTYQEAKSRQMYIIGWCANNYGLLGGPDFRIVKREFKPKN